MTSGDQPSEMATGSFPGGPRIFEAALASITDAVMIADSAGRVVYVNPAAESLIGWSSIDAAGKPLTVVFPVSSGIESVALEHAAMSNQHGRPLTVEYTTTQVHDDHGRFAGAVIVFRDLALRHAAERALQTSEETLLANAEALFAERERAEVTLNSIGDAVISTDFSGQVSYLNRVAEKMTGWTQQEASGGAIDGVFRLIDATTRKPISCPTTSAIIENQTVTLERPCLLMRRDGIEVAAEVSAAPIHDRNGGVIGAVMVAHDVTVARELSGKLARLAFHDSLTDLPNRALFGDRLGQAMSKAQVNGSSVALLYIDLDRFKHVNDTLGHAIGDQLLQTVALRLRGCVRGADTVSRQGGDEFVVVLVDVLRAQDAAACAEKIMAALQAPFKIGGHDLVMTASIGIATFPDNANDGDTLLRYADFALYQAKYDGRNTYRFFKPT